VVFADFSSGELTIMSLPTQSLNVIEEFLDVMLLSVLFGRSD